MSQVLLHRACGAEFQVFNPLWANVTSLMRFEGANGSTVFEDVKGLAWSAGEVVVTM